MAAVPDRKASAHVFAATLSSFTGCNIFVEGSTDASFWKCHCNRENVKIRAVNGCNKVIECVKKANDEGVKCVGIIDKDFRDYLEYTDVPDNVYILDDHDLEMMIYHSGDYWNVLSIYDKSDKIPKYEEEGVSLFETVAQVVRRIAALRFCSKKDNLNLAFSDQNGDQKIVFPNYERILDKINLAYAGDEKLIDYIASWTEGKRVVYERNRTTIKCCLDREDISGYDDWSFLNGHDFTLLLLLILNKKIKIQKTQIALEPFEDSLILSMANESLSATGIYRQLADWGLANNISLLK